MYMFQLMRQTLRPSGRSAVGHEADSTWLVGMNLDPPL
jgi:hypothetical protein